MTFRPCAVLLLLSLAARPAAAEVVAAAPNGFALKYVATIAAPPAIVYRAAANVGRWWDPAHSFTGQAVNLSLEPRAGGCFCERLPAGSVEHMRVVHADEPRRLLLHGAPGPLASMAVTGAMEWVMTAAGDGGTRLEVTYNASGYAPDGLASLAPVVDGVFAGQIARLRRFVETGRPE